MVFTITFPLPMPGKSSMPMVQLGQKNFIEDHLGNNPLTLKDDNSIAPVVQEDHYDPFGMVLSGQSTPDTIYADKKNDYLYNGKKFQDELGLDWYDYGARFYDAALGRFFTVDPLSEQYYGLSDYVYVANNPLKYIDPDGMRLRFHRDKSVSPEEYREAKRHHRELRRESPTYNQIVKDLKRSKTNYDVTVRKGGGTAVDKSDKTKMNWDINQKLDDIADLDLVINNKVTLAHDMGHLWQKEKNVDQFEFSNVTDHIAAGMTFSQSLEKMKDEKSLAIFRIERGATMNIENVIRGELKCNTGVDIPLRKKYDYSVDEKGRYTDAPTGKYVPIYTIDPNIDYYKSSHDLKQIYGL